MLIVHCRGEKLSKKEKAAKKEAKKEAKLVAEKEEKKSK